MRFACWKSSAENTLRKKNNFQKTVIEFIAGCGTIELYLCAILESRGGNRMISFSDAWLNLVNVVKSFRPTDVLDILITSFLVYKLITWAKVTRTGQLVKGLLALVIAYFLADWMQLQTMKVRDAVSIWQCPDFIGSYFSARTAYGAGEGWPQAGFPNWICFLIKRRNQWTSNGKQRFRPFAKLPPFFPVRKTGALM